MAHAFDDSNNKIDTVAIYTTFEQLGLTNDAGGTFSELINKMAYPSIGYFTITSDIASAKGYPAQGGLLQIFKNGDGFNATAYYISTTRATEGYPGAMWIKYMINGTIYGWYEVVPVPPGTTHEVVDWLSKIQGLETTAASLNSKLSKTAVKVDDIANSTINLTFQKVGGSEIASFKTMMRLLAPKAGYMMKG